MGFLLVVRSKEEEIGIKADRQRTAIADYEIVEWNFCEYFLSMEKNRKLISPHCKCPNNFDFNLLNQKQDKKPQQNFLTFQLIDSKHNDIPLTVPC